MSTGPWKSKMIPWERTILKMWKNRKTLVEIQQFLKEHNIKVSLPGISKFIKVRRTKSDPHRIKILSREDYYVMEPENENKKRFQGIVAPKIEVKSLLDVEEDKPAPYQTELFNDKEKPTSEKSKESTNQEEDEMWESLKRIK